MSDQFLTNKRKRPLTCGGEHTKGVIEAVEWTVAGDEFGIGTVGRLTVDGSSNDDLAKVETDRTGA